MKFSNDMKPDAASSAWKKIEDVEVTEFMRTIRGDTKFEQAGRFDQKTDIIRETIVDVQNLLIEMGILINKMRGDFRFTEAPLSQKAEIIHDTDMMTQFNEEQPMQSIPIALISPFSHHVFFFC
ncbi:hypothetical protein ES288_A03G015300v1 [Gossypium darwinii]|uniref:Uncharacterized protein n=1 Tax=Gossypium darwinii TaxID=34276 RepID=A0A5D2H0M4_GOSDA|nr:hypothetical protein ES288_A03G015300v1 [Gossypium darwinii]